MKKIIFIIASIFAISLVVVSCSKAKPKEVVMDANCSLIPEAGRCRAAFPKFYFNQESKSCEQFIWGGCGGVVPFQTQEDCEARCPVAK